MRLKDKVAIVTGAANGIGEAVAIRFAQEGAKVVLCDLNEEEVKRAEKKIKDQGGAVLGVVANVVNREQVDAMVKKAVETFGTVDILVNNAGITRDAIFHKMTEAQWDQVFDVNLKGVFHCTQAVVGMMRDKKYGRIINISSTSRFGNPGQANYAATKAGLVGFTRNMAKELGTKGVTVNAVAPGSVETAMFLAIPDKIREIAAKANALQRPGSVEELASAILFFASDDSSYITGQCLQVDGGMIMP
ncbi:MAG: 3-oxoacyl-ACP reductase FabG [Syntrophomonadaceae bacterium]|nr:3-oxoacyl-ACP reductase FabG [Syntrophomonadaceae bacterium]